jgi:hypothetical protein
MTLRKIAKISLTVGFFSLMVGFFQVSFSFMQRMAASDLGTAHSVEELPQIPEWTFLAIKGGTLLMILASILFHIAKRKNIDVFGKYTVEVSARSLRLKKRGKKIIWISLVCFGISITGFILLIYSGASGELTFFNGGGLLLISFLALVGVLVAIVLLIVGTLLS